MKIYFAPMQGYTDAPYRNLHDEIFGAIEEYYTPFIRIERGELRRRDLRDASMENDHTHRLVPQIIVKDVAEFDFLVEHIAALGHHRIDVNMGCPFPLQSRKGRGAGLLQYPERISEILTAIDRHGEIDFSVKMRLGYESADECMRLVDMLNVSRLRHITVHPRVAMQQYAGEPDMEAFSRFVEQCSVPVIYNGDILSIDDINRIEQQFPAISGVMIGRGLLMRPSLACEYLSGKVMTDDELMERVWRLHDGLMAHYGALLQGDGHLLTKMKTFWEYLEGLIGHKQYKAIKKSTTMAKYNAAISQL